MMLAKTRRSLPGPLAAFSFLIVFLLASPTNARAQNLSGAAPHPALSQPEGAPTVPKTNLADLAWLAGSWQGSWGPRLAQQVWSAPKGGVILGAFQLVENDKTLVLELITVVDKPDGLQLGLRHFTPSLVPWEKSDPIALNLVSSDPGNIVFENPASGEPKRESITRVDADTYVWRSEIVPDAGDTQVTEITYHRQKDVSSKKHGKQ